ncbi:MAG: hypothetical protein NW200_07260 [Hyphomonadaceae bacterium]|nr:hypothetical protein [Hyphomonadaceae bacterium]
MSTADAASVILNLLAFTGAGAFLLFHADERRRSPVDDRLSALFMLLMALVAARAVRVMFDLFALRRLEEALAAALPLAALVLAEGLMRRHAPGLMKRALLAGAVIFAALAFVRPAAFDLAFVAALGLFVAGGLSATALLLGLRDRRTLAPAENAAISALGLGLVVALPFVAVDFLHAAGLVPLRAGGLAMLIVVYATVRLVSTGGGGQAVLVDMGLALLGASGAFATFAAVMGAPDVVTGLAFLSVIFGLVLVILIVQGLREREATLGRQALLQTLAEAPSGPLDAFIDRMLDSPALQNATLLEGARLADYDGDALRASLAAQPVASLTDARARGPAGEPLAVLLDSHEGTHAVLISDTPLRVLVVNMPDLAAGPDVGLQLTLLRKLAMAADAAR